MVTKSKQAKTNESTKELSAEEIFQQVDTRNHKQCRLQSWNSRARKLWYVCGDGRQAVLVDSKGQVRKAWKNLKSKLSKTTVDKLRKNTALPKSAFILKKIMKILKEYIHFEDQRIYLLLALWIIASYLYSVFSYCGYLFFYSKLMRSGKTRVLEVLSHMAFNASQPLNAPTPINAGSKVKRTADEKCNTLIHLPICSGSGTGGRKGCTQTWRCGETFAGEST